MEREMLELSTVDEKSTTSSDEQSTPKSTSSIADDHEESTPKSATSSDREGMEHESDSESEDNMSEVELYKAEDEDWYVDEAADENMLIKGRRWTNDELLNLMEFRNDPRYIYRTTNKYLNKLRRFLKSVWESDGFDADHYPGSTWGVTPIRPRQTVIHHRIRHPEGYKYIMYLAHLALMHYNNHNNKNYKVDYIQKMNSRIFLYLITFTASSHNHNLTFQAKVSDNMLNHVLKVVSCDPKPGSLTYQSTDSILQSTQEEDIWLDDISIIGSKSLLKDDELWYFIQTYNRNHNRSRGAKNKDKYLKKVRRYLESIEKSKGFQCTDFPGRIDEVTSVEPKQEIIDLKNYLSECHSYLVLFAVNSIKVYNKQKRTQFRLQNVEKANSLLVMGYGTYYITFTAVDSQQDYLKTFEAKVNDKMFGWKVDFCRPKAEASPGV